MSIIDRSRMGRICDKSGYDCGVRLSLVKDLDRYKVVSIHLECLKVRFLREDLVLRWFDV